MVNFRVHDLDAMVAQLREAGIAVEVDPQGYPNVRFARLYDRRAIRLSCGNPLGEMPAAI
jgi:glyoxylase I family protein